MRSFVIGFILISIPTWAQTGASQKACAPYLSPWDLALHKHAMYSAVDGPMVLRALTHFMKKLDPYGTFFLESDHAFLNPHAGTLNNVRQQAEKQDYQYFQRILSRFTESVARAKTYLEQVPNLRAIVVERSTSEAFRARREKFDFRTPPKTVEEQNEKLIDYMTSIYSDYIGYKHDPAEAYLLTVREMKRVLEQIQAGAATPARELALKSMMAGLDPHTKFLNKREFEAFKEGRKSEFVGVELGERETVTGYIISPTPNGAAALAGLKEGDIITHVVSPTGAEVSVRGKSKHFLSDMLKGPENTQVTVRVRRGTENLRVPITRQTVSRTPDLIQAEVFEGPAGEKIGYIALRSFYDGADNHVASTLKRMVDEAKIDALAFDLRRNTGGDEKVALNIMSLLVDGGPGLLLNKFRSDVGRTIEVIPIPSGHVMFRGPVIIIVDEYSASAAELVALALRDHNRVIVVGGPSRTFGKGTKQITHAVRGADDKETGEGITVTEAVFLGPRGNTPNLGGVRIDIRLRENELPVGLLHSYPDTTMPNITVASRIPISKAGDKKHHDLIAQLSRLHQERARTEPPDPSVNQFDRERGAALQILLDYLHAVRGPR